MNRITKEQIEYIRSISDGKFTTEIADMFNKKYGQNRTPKAIAGVMYRNNIKNGMQGGNRRFKKGHEPWNKGKIGLDSSGGKGQFEKGHERSRLPVGEEGKKGEYITIKVSQPDKWEYKHRYVWKQHNGDIPNGYCVLFKDGDKQNCDIDNLFLTKKQVSASIARQNLQTEHPELNLATHKMIELELEARKRLNK